MTEPELNFETVADSRQLDELYAELCYCAYEVLVLHPGCGKVEWMDTLLHDYHTEVVDVYGWSEKMQEEGLSKLWYEDYTDESGATMPYESWSHRLCNTMPKSL